MVHHNSLALGIDISKQKLDVACSDHARVTSFPYTKAGLKTLLQLVNECRPTIICVEATGGLERQLLAMLHQHKLPVAVVNPRQIRDFARAANQLAKTDEIDARTIARFAQLMQPRCTPALTPDQQKIRDFTARKRQVTKLIVQEKNRLATTADTVLRRMIQAAIALYEQQRMEIDETLRVLIEANKETQTRARIIASVPGLGHASVAALLADLPELGTLNRQQIARLVGVAPTNRDSGTLRGKRTTGGGRVELRNALYMPTIVAKQYNPKIKAFYDRLVTNGKPKLVALIAAMRKLLTILNVMVREGTMWQNEPKMT